MVHFDPQGCNLPLEVDHTQMSFASFQMTVQQ